jgi:hypothetical protein
MAVRKTGAPKASPVKKPFRKPAAKGRGRYGAVPVSVVFGIFLLIALTIAFFMLLPKARNNASVLPQQPIERPAQQTQEKPPASQQDSRPPESPQAATPAPAPEPVNEPTIPGEQIPSPQPQPTSPAPPAAETPAVTERPADTRERGIYFMQAGRNDTELLPARTSRSIRVSDSPLLDSLNALLAGPTAEERNRGVLHFIPPETRIISVIVRGNTAYINFNDEFQYNTHGREGSAAQVRQIVWTATEFPNIRDVQFLVENKRLDFLAEGVMIGSPIGR